MTHVLGIDPGKMTGISHAYVKTHTSDLVNMRTEELDFKDTVALLNYVLGAHVPRGFVVVIERFTVMPHTTKKSFQPDALWMIGAVKACMVLNDYDPDTLVMQSPASAKGIATNDMIRDVGLWHRGGAGHAQDASRHVLLYLLTHGWRPDSIVNSLHPAPENSDESE